MGRVGGGCDWDGDTGRGFRGGGAVLLLHQTVVSRQSALE